MPLVIIDSLPPQNEDAIFEIMKDIREVGAKAMKCPTSNIWVMFRQVQSGYYIQGDLAADSPKANSHPPIVTVRAHAGRSREVKSHFVKWVAEAVGKGLSIPPENVWIHYQETQREDVWFKGHWENGSDIK